MTTALVAFAGVAHSATLFNNGNWTNDSFNHSATEPEPDNNGEYTWESGSTATSSTAAGFTTQHWANGGTCDNDTCDNDPEFASFLYVNDKSVIISDVNGNEVNLSIKFPDLAAKVETLMTNAAVRDILLASVERRIDAVETVQSNHDAADRAFSLRTQNIIGNVGRTDFTGNVFIGGHNVGAVLTDLQAAITTLQTNGVSGGSGGLTEAQVNVLIDEAVGELARTVQGHIETGASNQFARDEGQDGAIADNTTAAANAQTAAENAATAAGNAQSTANQAITNAAAAQATADANTTAIGINADNIAINAENIAENSEDIATNANDIATNAAGIATNAANQTCLLYTSPSPRDRQKSRMPSSA